jgi:DNA primase
MIEINQLTLAYFRRHFSSSWGRKYLADRFTRRLDQPDRASTGPRGQRRRNDHHRRRRPREHGRLIDCFRDRVVFPIINNGEVLGFVGRRHPDLSDLDRAAPKYLNTGETPLFHKRAQLYGVLQDQLSIGAIPVLVDGPMDATAVTLASRGRYIGMSLLGTSLTEEQASQLAHLGVHPIVATDADPAGRSAAERDYSMLSCYRVDP